MRSNSAELSGQPRVTRAGIWRSVLDRPATVFVLLSLLVGTATVFLNPPLRGPDESAHFLRIYSYAKGELLPSTEMEGRKGTFIPADLQRGVEHFDSARSRYAKNEVRYADVMRGYQTLKQGLRERASDEQVFATFAGTEGYTPVAYLPYIPAAAVGRLFGLDFVPLQNLMRLSGLLFFTAIAAYAIAITPVLKWAFLLIGLLPASIYGRSVLSADGAALSFTLAIAALTLAVLRGYAPDRPWLRSIWMTLCVLSKQPQIAFVAMEPMIGRVSRLWNRAPAIALVVLPGIVLSPLWVYAVSADIAVWRIQMGLQRPPEHFDPVWKLWFMWENPAHFPQVWWTSLSNDFVKLGRELIGVLGWLDVPLVTWVYPVLGLLLFTASVQGIGVERPARARVALFSITMCAGYGILVYLILFLTWTPPDAEHIWGVQGRYFVVALPCAAMTVAAAFQRGLPERWLAASAVGAALLAGVATVEAIVRVHW